MVNLEDILKQHNKFTASYKMWNDSLFMLDYKDKHIYFNPVCIEGEAYIHAMARAHFIEEEGEDNALVRRRAQDWAKSEYQNNHLRYYKLAMNLLEPPYHGPETTDMGD